MTDPISERPAFPTPPRGLPSVVTTWAGDMVRTLTQIAGEANPRLNDVIRKSNEVVAITDFNAKGDGVFDNASAIQAAHDALPAAGGQITMPAGVFLFGTTLAFTKRIVLTGQGSAPVNVAGPTVLMKAAGLNGIGIKVTGAGTIFENFIMDGEGGNGGDGISAETNSFTARSVSVFHQGRDGIRIGTDAGVNANLWCLDKVVCTINGQHGLHISDKTSPTLADANAGTATAVTCNSNTKDGVFLGNCIGNSFFGLTVENNVEHGVHISGDASENAFFGGDWDESNVIKDLIIDSGAEDNSIIFPRIRSSKLSDAGTRTTLWHNDTSNPGTTLRGLFDLLFEQGAANYIRCRASGGELSFVMNGESASAANSMLIIETDGLVFGKSGTKITKHLSASATLDFADPGTLSSADLTITVTGAALSDTVVLGVPNGAVTADTCFTAWVSAANTVTVRFNNYSSGAREPASGTFRVDVWQH